MTASIGVGSVHVDVVPSARDFVKNIRQQVLREADELGKEVGQRISQGIKGPIERAISDAIGDGVDKADTRSKAAKKGQQTGGAFAKALKAELQSALANLPDADVEVNADLTELNELRAQMAALTNKTVGVDISGEEALREIAKIRAALGLIGDRTTSIQLKFDVDRALADLEKLPNAVDKLLERNEGSFAKSFSSAMQQAFDTLPDLNFNADSTEADHVLDELRARLLALSKVRVGIDMGADEALAEIAQIRAALALIGDRTTNVQLKFDIQNAIKDLDQLPDALNQAFERNQGNFARTLRSSLQGAIDALPDVEIGLDSTRAQVELDVLRTELQRLSEQTIGVDIDAAQALTQIATLRAALARMASTATDVRVRLDIQDSIAQLDTLTKRIDESFDRNAGAYATKLRAALASALQSLPEVELRSDMSAVEADLAVIRGELARLTEQHIRFEIDDAEALARAAGLRAVLESLRDDANIELQFDIDKAVAALDGFRDEARKAAEAASGEFANTFRDRVTSLASALPDIKLSADSSDVDETIAEVRARLTALSDRTIGVHISDAEALAELAAIEADLRSLPNNIPINFRTNAAKVITEIAALREEAGGAGGSFRNLGQAVEAAGASAGRSLPGMALGLSRVQLIGVAVLAVFPLISAAILALPAAIALIAAPIAAIVAGIDGLKAAVIPLTPAFQALQAIVSATFMQTMAPAIQDVAGMIPLLTSGLVGTAGALSTIAAQIAEVLSSASGLSALDGIFDNINSIIAGIAPSIGELVQNFLTLGEQASEGLQSLVTVMNQAGDAWATTLAQMAQTGTVQAAVSALVQVFGGLMNILPPLVQIGAQLLQVFGPALAGALNATAVVLQTIASAITITVSAFQSLSGGAQNSTSVMQQFGQVLLQSGIPGLNTLGAGLLFAANQSIAFKAAAAEATQQLTPMQAATKAAADAQTAYTQAVHDFGPNTSQAASAASTLADATSKLEGMQKQAADAAKTLTEQLKEQATQFQDIVGSTLDYEQALMRVADAEKATAEAVKKHGANSKEAKEAVLSEAQAIEQAALAAQKKAQADTASLGPQAQAQAGVAAYSNVLLGLANEASPQARAKLLEIAQGMTDTEIAAASAAAKATGLATEIVKLPNGKTITIIADTNKAVAGITDVQKKASAPVTAPVTANLKNFIGPVSVERQKAAAQVTTPVGADLKSFIGPVSAERQKAAAQVTTPVQADLKKFVGPVSQERQKIAGTPATMPVEGDKDPVTTAIGEVQQKAAASAAKIPVTLDTAGADVAIGGYITSLSGKQIQLKITPVFTDADTQLNTWIAGLATKPAPLKITLNFVDADAQLNLWIAALLLKPAILKITLSFVDADAQLNLWIAALLLKPAILKITLSFIDADTQLNLWIGGLLLKPATINITPSFTNADLAIGTWIAGLATRPAVLNVTANPLAANQAVDALVTRINTTTAVLLVSANPQPAIDVINNLLDAIAGLRPFFSVDADVNPAINQINALLAAIPKVIVIPVVLQFGGIGLGGGGVTGGGGDDPRLARGGIVQRNAAGNVNDLRPMSGRTAAIVQPNTWRIIGDRIHGAEAFIPINNSARSMALLKYTANQMGHQLTPLATGGVFDKVLAAGLSSQALSTQQAGSFLSAAFGKDSPETGGENGDRRSGDSPLIGTVNLVPQPGASPSEYTDDLMFALRHARHGGLYSDAR